MSRDPNSLEVRIAQMLLRARDDVEKAESALQKAIGRRDALEQVVLMLDDGQDGMVEDADVPTGPRVVPRPRPARPVPPAESEDDFGSLDVASQEQIEGAAPPGAVRARRTNRPSVRPPTVEVAGEPVVR